MSGSEQLKNRKCNSTRANYEQIKLSHLSMSWDVDFESKKLKGSITWSVEVLAPTEEMILDAKTLAIERVTVDGKPATFSLGDEHAAFGRPLSVTLPKAGVGAKLKVAIYYETSPESSALQWLPKECTAGKKLPYLFSQCQAIHARALIPCQDTPAAKFTYDAAITVPEWATALMSAVSAGSKRKGAPGAGGGTTSFSFEQKIPIPSYLLALAVRASLFTAAPPPPPPPPPHPLPPPW
jgi:leukotriene-A4 hydrolase